MKTYGITKSQLRFLEEYMRSADKAQALRAGGYSTSQGEESIERNFTMIMEKEKVRWAYQSMLREREKEQAEMAQVEEELKALGVDPSTIDNDAVGIIKVLDEGLALEKRKRSGTGMAQIAKTKAEMLGLYQPKKQAQKVLQITIVTEFDPNDQGGGIDYED